MTVISLGTFGRNETPLDLTYRFTDAAGTPIDLTGATVVAKFRNPYGTETEAAGYLDDAADGVAGFAWLSTMTDTAGPWSVTVWADLAGQVIGSAVIVYNVHTTAAPTFT